MTAIIRWIKQLPYARVVIDEGNGDEGIGLYSPFELRQLAKIMENMQPPERDASSFSETEDGE